MKAVLISPIKNVTAANFRGLGAALAAAGHDVVQVFLPDVAAEGGRVLGREFPYETPYPASLVADVATACAGAGLVGVSLMTNHFERAADLTARLRPMVRAPIIWGGIHPTVRPEECLEYADAVALGEADETLLDFVGRLGRGDEWRRTPGFYARDGGDVVRNPITPPPADLGALPLPLYQPAKDLIQDREAGRLVPLTDELLARYTDLISPHANAGVAGSLYMANASRGCQHACSFCSNAFLKKLHGGYKGTRWRPAAHVLAELAQVRRRWPFVKYVFFSDDELLAMPDPIFDEFADRYAAEVGLPFRCFTSADTVSRERLARVVPAGFFLAEVGIQSAAAATQKSFRRQWLGDERILAAVRVMNEFAPALVPTYDLIVDNPYETTAERLATLRFVTRLPRPFFLQAFSLTFYPGTDLYERARADGLITDDRRQVYRKNSLAVERRDYIHILTTLNNRAVPRALIRAAAWRPFVWLATHAPGSWAFAAAAALARAAARLLRGGKG